ncbi:maleylpyruvate isomerase N-terminal domain-containing protein [Hymenobacter sp. ASUV-10]|uniref:Maleylpyruvate isomerase N-terminal domain-containing protein n=1 Tax=Hymenobacter aranciens TaxID=3063996 RepID=A0ABT9BBB5_9BACT|nr:maleylpyruvate isomerase N-terminal domain-containing protein [Hymenobacter sp. ASUV-10]MDO7875556.1 maleylpyruvate isomerase N-terminal domain-containing protein [Hymenobacter sp. ASUV-10]
MPHALPAIDVLPLFPVLDRKLITLLQSLTPADWQRLTLARRWTVKDIAAHLLDGNLRTLSMLRDGYFGEASGAINSYDDLLAFLNRLNAEWVTAMRRLSPVVLIELLIQSGREYAEFLATLDPQAPAAFAVAWAGESESVNWFHIAREYTEKWHHQQQIRETVGQTAELLTPELFRPFIETFMRGLPHAYRQVAAPVGTVVQVRVTTASGGSWQLVKGEAGWRLQNVAPDAVLAAEVVLMPETAWRLFTKGIDPATAEAESVLHGDRELALAALRMVAVMA